MGVILNFAAAYRATNYVLTDIEETEGLRPEGFDYYEKQLGTRGYGVDRNGFSISCSITDAGSPVYTIETGVTFEIPMIGAKLTIPVRYDTKAIYTASGCNDAIVGSTTGWRRFK